MEVYKKYFEKEKFFYNYRRSNRKGDEPVIFCVDNPERSRHYGDILRIFRPTNKTLDITNKNNIKVKELVKYTTEFLKEWNPYYRDDENDIEMSPQKEFELSYQSLNPRDIVESAGIWDNIEFINYLYDNTEIFNKYDGVITEDGAVFFEVTKKNLVKTVFVGKESCSEKTG